MDTSLAPTTTAPLATAPVITAPPTQWVTSAYMLGNGQQTKVYGSFVSARIVSSDRVREEVYVVSCAPSQCGGTEIPEQTVTQRKDLLVCPGDPRCSSPWGSYPSEQSSSLYTYDRWNLGWEGTVTADGTTTEWAMRLTEDKDHPRTPGAPRVDEVTWIATTRVGDEVKATVSTVHGAESAGAWLDHRDCAMADKYAVMVVTAGLDELYEATDEWRYLDEPVEPDNYRPGLESTRSECAVETGDATTASGPSNTESPEDEGAGGKLSLSVALMGALLAVGVLLP